MLAFCVYYCNVMASKFVSPTSSLVMWVRSLLGAIHLWPWAKTKLSSINNHGIMSLHIFSNIHRILVFINVVCIISILFDISNYSILFFLTLLWFQWVQTLQSATKSEIIWCFQEKLNGNIHWHNFRVCLREINFVSWYIIVLSVRL